MKTQFEKYGRELSRPECVLTFSDGGVFASDKEHGIVRVFPEYSIPIPLKSQLPDGVVVNGFCYIPNLGFLVANIGDAGGVWLLNPGQEAEPFLTEWKNKPLPPTNFVGADQTGLWVSISTIHSPRHLAYNRTTSDGFVLHKPKERKWRKVLSKLAYANEVKVDPGKEFVYVNETMARRISRAPIRDGVIGDIECFHQFGEGDFVDGIQFDTDGGVWVVSIVSNRIWRIQKNAAPDLILVDTDLEHLKTVEKAFDKGVMARTHMDGFGKTILRNISSMAWSEPDLSAALIGSLSSNTLFKINTSHIGAEPIHWNTPSPF